MIIRHIALLLVAGCLAFAVEVQAITTEELAGVYYGKRTETSAFGVVRYDEIDIIEPDGFAVAYVKYLGEYRLSGWGMIELSEDGTFGNAAAMGSLSLHGRHLAVTVVFPPTVYSFGGVVEFQGHRVNKGLEPPFFRVSEGLLDATLLPWAPFE